MFSVSSYSGGVKCHDRNYTSRNEIILDLEVGAVTHHLSVSLSLSLEIFSVDLGQWLRYFSRYLSRDEGLCSGSLHPWPLEGGAQATHTQSPSGGRSPGLFPQQPQHWLCSVGTGQCNWSAWYQFNITVFSPPLLQSRIDQNISHLDESSQTSWPALLSFLISCPSPSLRTFPWRQVT